MARNATGITLTLALAIGTTGMIAPAVAAAASTKTVATASAGRVVAGRVVAGEDGSLGGPVPAGRLRITGNPRDGSIVAATGLTWRHGRLPAGDRVLSFAVAYSWQSCAAGKCRAAADSTATPFAAGRYVVGHADAGRVLKVTETAAEVVQTKTARFTFKVIRAARSVSTSAAVAKYPAGRGPASEFVNGLPERSTGSDAEYFQVDSPHYSQADGPVSQLYRIDRGPWRTMPPSHVFYTGKLRLGQHTVAVRTSDQAGHTAIGFAWRVVPLPAPLACRGSCWYPQHLNSAGRPMRWDWQIGRTFPKQRTGKRAVDLYDIDGFLTTKAQVRAIHTSWQASTLAHPGAVCYLDLAWEDYRPDGSPSPRGLFPAAALGNVYYGYPEERWVDFRQLDALKPMLTERLAMCARKGFDAVELDDIDSFDPPGTTGFDLTAGDAQNYLAYAFNLVHRYGMTALWKNSPELARWGVHYTDGAVLEECYQYRECRTWDVFTSAKSAAQPTGKWVGEAEYGADHYVCNPGQAGSKCQGRRSFAAFCHAVYRAPNGFAAVKFDVDLDGQVFYPCPRGS